MEVFVGNTADPTTVAAQVNRIRDNHEPMGLDWISALTKRDICKLLQPDQDEAAPPRVPEDLTDDAVAEVNSPDVPGERLMVCLNIRRREERRHKRVNRLHATTTALDAIALAVRAGRIRTQEQINRRKMGQHFVVTVSTGQMARKRQQERISPGQERSENPPHSCRFCRSCPRTCLSLHARSLY